MWTWRVEVRNRRRCDGEWKRDAFPCWEEPILQCNRLRQDRRCSGATWCRRSRRQRVRRSRRRRWFLCFPFRICLSIHNHVERCVQGGTRRSGNLFRISVDGGCSGCVCRCILERSGTADDKGHRKALRSAWRHWRVDVCSRIYH